MKRFTSIAFLLCTVLSNGCKKQTDVGPDVCAQISTQTDAVSKAATAYAATVNRTNCEAYRTALRNYIDAATKCPGASQADLSVARANLNATTCP